MPYDEAKVKQLTNCIQLQNQQPSLSLAQLYFQRGDVLASSGSFEHLRRAIADYTAVMGLTEKQLNDNDLYARAEAALNKVRDAMHLGPMLDNLRTSLQASKNDSLCEFNIRTAAIIECLSRWFDKPDLDNNSRQLLLDFKRVLEMELGSRSDIRDRSGSHSRHRAWSWPLLQKQRKESAGQHDDKESLIAALCS